LCPGIGVAKLIQLPGGYTLYIYAEAQPSVYRAGDGAPNFQFYTERQNTTSVEVHTRLELLSAVGQATLGF